MSASFALSKRASARSIAVIGGGASGALIAAHLLKCADDDVHLTLIEPRAQIGRGLAYATENESHRLNVRASNMSAFPDDPDHFWRWLRASGHAGEDRFCFVPRLVYGRYLASLIEDRLTEPEAGRLRWLRKTVGGLKEHDGSVVLRFPPVKQPPSTSRSFVADTSPPNISPLRSSARGGTHAHGTGRQIRRF